MLRYTEILTLVFQKINFYGYIVLEEEWNYFELLNLSPNLGWLLWYNWLRGNVMWMCIEKGQSGRTQAEKLDQTLPSWTTGGKTCWHLHSGVQPPELRGNKCVSNLLTVRHMLRKLIDTDTDVWNINKLFSNGHKLLGPNQSSFISITKSTMGLPIKWSLTSIPPLVRMKYSVRFN